MSGLICLYIYIIYISRKLQNVRNCHSSYLQVRTLEQHTRQCAIGMFNNQNHKLPFTTTLQGDLKNSIEFAKQMWKNVPKILLRCVEA